MRRLPVYIYQQTGWPQFHWNRQELDQLLTKLRHHGRLLGRMESMDFTLQTEGVLNGAGNHSYIVYVSNS